MTRRCKFSNIQCTLYICIVYSILYTSCNVHYTLCKPYGIVYIAHCTLCYATKRRISGDNFVRGMFLAKFEESMPDLVVNIAEFLKCILIRLIRSYLAYSAYT